MSSEKYPETMKLLGFTTQASKTEKMKNLLEGGAYSIEEIKSIVGTDNPYNIFTSLKDKGIKIASYWVEKSNGIRYTKYFVSGKYGDNFQEFKKAVGFYEQMKPKPKTPEEEEQERKEYEDFLYNTLKQTGEKK